jgi:S-adenosylmethionine hydrolase
MPGLFPLPREEDGGLVAEVLWVDRYGNAQLNVAPEELDALGTYFELRLDQGRHSARRADHFAAITPGGLGLVVDSTGLVALAADRSSAAEELRIGAGDPVTLVPLDADEPSAAPGVPVQLGRRPDPTTATGAEP